MTDIATLGYEVDSSGLDRGTRALEANAQAAERTAAAAAKVETSYRAVSRSSAPVEALANAHIRLKDAVDRENGVRDRLTAYLNSQRGMRMADAQAVTGQAKAMGEAAISAAQLKAATRGLPAQFTDIVTALQAGQSPMQVLLQQGGQIKDQFGGVGLAARGMAGYVMGLVNPFTLAGAAIAGLGAAAVTASSEVDGLNRSLIQSGMFAQLTTEDMRLMAAELDSSTSATAGKATDVLSQVAATGRFTGEELQKVARAAIEMEDAFGQAVEKTISDFVRLKDAPSEYIQKLNEAGVVNNFLTEEALRATRELEEQGRQAEAVRLVMDEYGSTVETRTAQVTGSLGLWSSFWRQVKLDAREAFDEIVDGFRDSDRAHATFLGALRAASPALGSLLEGYTARAVTTQQANRAKPNPFAFEDAWLSKPAPGMGNPSGMVDPAMQRERDRFQREGLRYQSESLRMEREIKDVQALVTRGVIEQAQAESRIAAIKRSYAERASKGRRSGKSDEEREAEQLQRSFESLSGQLTRQIALHGQVGEAARIAYDVQYGALKGLSQPRKDELVDLARKVDLLKMEEAGLDRLNARMEAEQNAMQRTIEGRSRMIEDLEFEIALIGKSALQQEQMIALRRAGVDANSAYGQSLLELVEMQYMLVEQDRLMQDVRGAAMDMFASFLDGSKSAGDAFEDFTHRLRRLAAQMLAEKAVQWLFGMFMGSVGGVQRQGIGAIPSLTGREYGGFVSKSGMYRVGERNKPELLSTANGAYLIPGDNGRVDPIRAAPAVARAGMGTPQININLMGAPEGTTATARQNRSGGFDIDVMVAAMEGKMASNYSQGAGPLYAAVKGRHGLRDQV